MFSNETASGWQQVLFPLPVVIAPNTTYVASYHTNAGHFADDVSYFALSGFDKPPLHALKDGRFVFNICGNRYRLVVHCRHPYAFVRFIGTHAEYDRIDAQTC